MHISLTLGEGLIIVFGVVLFGLILVRQWLIEKRIVKRLDARLSQFQEELEGVTQASVGLGKRLVQLDKEITDTANTLPRGCVRENTPQREVRSLSYSEASRLANLGVEVQDLVKSCGLSMPEAELVKAVTKRDGRGMSRVISRP